MSIRFKTFMERIGKETEFKPIKNQLLMALKEDSENKYKNYPRLLEMMQEYWPKYKKQSKISHLLLDHYEEFFNFYMNTIFPFRKRGLKFEDPEAPTPVDFKLVFSYHFKVREIDAIKEIISDLGLDISISAVLKRIFIFTITSFGYLVEEIFQRPFAFQIFSIDANELSNGEWEVEATISGREQ
ncbi:MAG: hypothetical protein GF317_10235 [Candidatus Lokiarchaeota archaeon]|nr:hypothetical protein [Candidatus Lokiarchaeota archaeon]MBD3200038.1 hypothetical protein [Candidatus Lokiarchaeota archaeon]